MGEAIPNGCSRHIPLHLATVRARWKSHSCCWPGGADHRLWGVRAGTGGSCLQPGSSAGPASHGVRRGSAGSTERFGGFTASPLRCQLPRYAAWQAPASCPPQCRGDLREPPFHRLTQLGRASCFITPTLLPPMSAYHETL